MQLRHNVDLNKISWLTTTKGEVKHFYEPETIDELVELCKSFYQHCVSFDLIGHTSNIYYVPGYHVENMISTRKIRGFKENDNFIECDCGTSVKQLSHEMINQGVKGFEGLVDLPGTVASAIYGNAGCYDCSLSELLLKAEVLTEDGEVIDVLPDWFSFQYRSSSLKRKEKKGVILKLYLKKEKGDPETLNRIAQSNHDIRCATQPGPKDSLGSIFVERGNATIGVRIVFFISRIYNRILYSLGIKEQNRKDRVLSLQLLLLCNYKLRPYLRTWNWWQWKDKKSHELFWKYVHLHQKVFSESELEIEIKANKYMSY